MIQDELTEFAPMMASLSADVEHAREEINKAPNQFWMRSYVRALFALVEAMNHNFQQYALHKYIADLKRDPETGSITLPIPAMCLLMSESYSIDDKGEIKIRSVKTPFLSNTLFSLNQMRTAFAGTRQIIKDKGWESFMSAVKIRDRITHPKTHNEIELSMKEIETIDTAHYWYMNEVFELMATFPGLPPELNPKNVIKKA